MRFFCLFILSISAFSQNKTQESFAFQRVFSKAEEDPAWPKLNLREKLMKVRALALKEKTVSDPVSDRYQITAYGGPIDLVHFLMLAAEAQLDEVDMKKRLFTEWEQEGGYQHLNGFNPQYPCEAHPDDLPSNALGALFGEELKNNGLNGSLKDSFAAFLKPLMPVPDAIAKKFSHRLIVMGLPEKIDRQTENSRHIWFSAEPLNISKLINYESKKQSGKEFCKTLSSGKDCLREAGFRLEFYKSKSIIITRL